jgi:hypothetical protein
MSLVEKMTMLASFGCFFNKDAPHDVAHTPTSTISSTLLS